MTFEQRKRLSAEHRHLRDVAAFALQCQSDEAKRPDHDKSAIKLLFNVHCDLFREAASVFYRMQRYETIAMTEKPNGRGPGRPAIPGEPEMKDLTNNTKRF